MPETTERAVVHDIEATRKTLAELKEVGVQIAIDDFGTGYAVLSHLKSLPVDMLKIDTGFVRDLGPTPVTWPSFAPSSGLPKRSACSWSPRASKLRLPH